jgi:hypothetical protein
MDFSFSLLHKYWKESFFLLVFPSSPQFKRGSSESKKRKKANTIICFTGNSRGGPTLFF